MWTFDDLVPLIPSVVSRYSSRYGLWRHVLVLYFTVSTVYYREFEVCGKFLFSYRSRTVREKDNWLIFIELPTVASLVSQRIRVEKGLPKGLNHVTLFFRLQSYYTFRTLRNTQGSSLSNLVRHPLKTLDIPFVY